MKDMLQKMLQKVRTAHGLFIVVAALFGLFFVFSTPLLWGADETTHVGRVYQLSQGRTFSYAVFEGYSKYGFGGEIPSHLKEVINYVNYDFNVNTHQVIGGVKWVDEPSDYKRFASLSMDKKMVPYNFSNTAIYPPFSYAPSVIAFIVANILHLNVGSTIYLGRIFDLAFYITMIAFVLWSLRNYRVKWIFFAVALLPSSLYQASFINADTVTNALAFTLVALILKALMLKKPERFTKLETVILAVTAIGLPVVKPTYIFIALLALVVPAAKIPFAKYRKFVIPVAVVLGILLFAVWQYKTRYLSNASKWIIAGVVPWWQQIDSSGQVSYVLHHPLSFMASFIRSHLLADGPYFQSLFGRLGFNYVPIPTLAITASFIALVLSVLGAEIIPRNKKVIIAFFAVFLAGYCAIFATLYLTISSVGMPTIEGVQGRYFLPLVPIGLIILAYGCKLRLNLSRPQLYRQFTYVLSGLVVSSLLLSAIKFFYVTWG